MNRVLGWAKGSVVRTGLLVVAGLAIVIQLIPYGRSHANPPITRELRYDSARTEQLVNDSCAACHSNHTSWPIESSVAPFSWLIQHDVDDGRATLNFSEWDRAQQAPVGELVDAVNGGEMPPLQYTLLHPSSKLSGAEKADLVAGLTKSYSQDPPGP